MMRKRREKKKDVINVRYAQYREMKGMEKMREFVIFFWLCSMAEHIKLGSNPSSQYLLHLVCCYIPYGFAYITHTNIMHRWMVHVEMRASQYSQTDNSIWSDMGCYCPSRKEEKN